MKFQMKIIQKTIKKAYDNWKPNSLVRCYHYAAAFDGTRMIEFAQNNPIKMSTKASKRYSADNPHHKQRETMTAFPRRAV